jgi:multidrug efflux pump subunit AcrB
MRNKTKKIGEAFQLVLLICILAYLIAWNTGCSSCSDKGEIEKARIEGYEKGKNDGYNQGHKIGYGEGYKKGEDDGYKKGYKKGTSFFLHKWWKPSLGLVIIALIIIFAFSTLYYVLKKPTRRLILQLQEQTENYLKQKKLNKEMEQKIKIMEEREKHRFTLMIQAIFDSARQYLNEKDAKASLEKLEGEAKKMIQKAQINDLEKIVSEYKEKLRKEIAERGTKSQKVDIILEPESDYLKSGDLSKALPEGAA